LCSIVVALLVTWVGVVKIAGVGNFWPATSGEEKLNRWRRSKKLLFSIRENWNKIKNYFRSISKQKTKKQVAKNQEIADDDTKSCFGGWIKALICISFFFPYVINRLVLPSNLNRCTHSTNSAKCLVFQTFSLFPI
jgi:hypothetical protein